MRSILLLFLSASAVIAQSSAGLRSSDTILTASQLAAELSGKVLHFYDGGAATFAADGQYSYQYDGSDEKWTGAYVLNAESEACVEFENGFTRCDLYIKDGDRLILITAEGVRFPIKEISEHGS